MKKLYTELAPYWQLVSPTSDYKDEAGFFIEILKSQGIRTVLELGSGGGNIAYYLKHHFEMTLTDISPEMLEQSKKQNPECAHIVGSMFDLRLNQTFDAVFLHDASSYITSPGELERTMETCSLHTKAGGTAVIAPDTTREHFRSGTRTESHTSGNVMLSCKETVGELSDDGITYNYDFEITITENGKTAIHHDHHTAGVFSTGEWTGAFKKYGFSVQTVADPLSVNEGHERSIIFVARKFEGKSC